MSEENLKIADIIFAYIKGTITDSELGELTAWMDAAEDHRELFQQIMTSASYQNKETVYRRFDSYSEEEAKCVEICCSSSRYCPAFVSLVFIANKTRGYFSGRAYAGNFFAAG